MNLIERIRSGNPQLQLIWRFYIDSTREWRWQQLAFDGTVVERSKTAYPEYEACLANACKHGYASFPALSTKTNEFPRQVNRSHMGLARGRQNAISEIETEAVEQKEDMPIDDVLSGD
jgi:hypothetical protein